MRGVIAMGLGAMLAGLDCFDGFYFQPLLGVQQGIDAPRGALALQALFRPAVFFRRLAQLIDRFDLVFHLVPFTWRNANATSTRWQKRAPSAISCALEGQAVKPLQDWQLQQCYNWKAIMRTTASLAFALCALLALPLRAGAVGENIPDAGVKLPRPAGACLPSVGALDNAGRVVPSNKLPSRNKDDQQITSAMDLFGTSSEVTASSLRMPIRPGDGFANNRDYADFLAHRGQFSQGISFSRACAATTLPNQV